MSRNYFRAFGALTLLVNPAIFADVFSGTLTRPQLVRSLFLMAAVEILGFGLAFLRKWAALYFAIPLFYFGLRLALTSIYEVVFPLNLFGMINGVSLMLPLVITIRIWKELTWGRRFF